MPEGAAEQVTPETDRAIESGLAWLAKQQNSDGSYGSGAYRGNIAVTSLAGLAFMANGSSPGRGPFGPQIDKALHVRDGQHRAVGLHRRRPTPGPTARCTRTASAHCSWPKPTG